jgi:RNA ligase (TIGR02306 family)
MRTLASVETVAAIFEHSNADSLELAQIRGWQVVTRKGEFQPGEKVVYFEIDSWIPTAIAPFLSKGKEPRVFEGISGERLRTIKLRGKISQGLILPISILGDVDADDLVVGDDVTDALGILKWEAPIPTALQGQVAGSFPHFIKKTDQERVQNIFADMQLVDSQGTQWVVEEKLDGSSCTIYVNFKRDVAEGYYEVGVCSRNLELKINEENANNAYIKAATEAGYLVNMFKLNLSFAIQAELCGPGIQGNRYKLDKPTLFVFDIWLIDEHRHATYVERENILVTLRSMGVVVEEVPRLEVISQLPESVEQCLLKAEGKSAINPKTEREGIVFKTTATIDKEVVSFKAISNKFLMAEKE